jgi:hypothetical protein
VQTYPHAQRQDSSVTSPPSLARKHGSLNLMLVLVGLFVLAFPSVVKMMAVPHEFAPWNIVQQVQQTTALREARQGAAAREVVALRQRHGLRPLDALENGAKIQQVPAGTYGFSTCGAASLRTGRNEQSVVEIHKRRDGIVYYVGYASRDDVAKYLARKKNFHILTSPSSTDGTSILFEIPIEFVAKCAVRPSKESHVLDLFVASIPKLH